MSAYYSEHRIIEVFVDREEEIKCILDMLNRVVEESSRGVIYLTGFGGIGKSTLLKYLLWKLSRNLESEGIFVYYIDFAENIPISQYLYLLAKKLLLQHKINLDMFFYFYILYLRQVEGTEPSEIRSLPDVEKF